MRILRLPKIKQQRVFRDFVWPADLPSFAQYNVIYGWNGTGKTTLSSLFANLQDKRAIVEGEVEFELDNGNKLSGATLVTATAPPVRVFNRDFVTRTIESIGQGHVAPIYFLGTESIEQQKQVEGLKKELEIARKAVTEADGDKRKADKALDEFCIEKGKLIRETLLGSAQYTNYDKRRFKDAVVKLKRQSPQPTALSNEQKQSLRKQKELQAKPSVPRLIFTPPDLESLHFQTSELLKRSVVSQVIDALVNNVSVAAWVQQGLALHKGEHETDTCRFCGNGFSAERRAKLEGHFNDAFTAFQREIDAAIRDIDGQQKSLASIIFPDESRLYDHLVSSFQDAVATANQAIQSVDQALEFFKGALERKKSSPFDVLALEHRDKTEYSDGKTLEVAIHVVNGIIDKHEETTTHLEDEVKQACESLEQDYVLDALPKFDELSSSLTEATTALATANEKPGELRRKIEEIELKIVEHRRPAEELNRELRAYLGRDELQFAIKETGYALTRGGKPAQHLSEGERTAIAFLYFLKSLEDKAFDLSKGIVVIDDPVSSLDANALFSAFGYMKERTKACHQLFIFTHNFAFFRQIKNWFHHLKGQKSPHIVKRPGRFYALLSKIDGCERSATLTPIDPLLEQFESEYHFLFRQVYDVANSAVCSNGLAQFYGIPNIARRLIETFLAYRFPDCSGDLIKRLERVDYDAEKKTRILRLLNTYSHSGGISDPEHDPSVLAETGEVMKAILAMMKWVDGDHYQGMVKLMCPVQEGE